MDELLQCPCHSGLIYSHCCRKYHLGSPAETAEALMRSRFSAYALGLADYIIDTTHPHHEDSQQDLITRRKNILEFSENTRFDGLKIREFIEKSGDEAFVTFTAFLTQNDQDARFTEKSRFLKHKDRWLYESGEMSH
jgi:SEC-C motif-containing protein